LRIEGNDAVYNLDYQVAREKFDRMVKIAPDHPAGYIYLANNLWLEWLNSSRRLSASLYNGDSFYQQDAEEDKFDPKREKEFNDYIRQAIAVAKARVLKNPQDTEALYYQGAALGLRAGYSVTVKRSFRRAMGDANNSTQIQKKVVKLDPNYNDAYLSIGLYEYVIDSLPFVWRTLARLAGLKGSKQKGLEHLELATRKGRFAADDARVILIGLYSREKQPEKALEMISYLAAKYPRNYLLGVERANMLYQRGRKEEGAAAFAALLKNQQIAQTASDHINYQWGESLRNSGDFAGAIERYKEVTRWSKSDKSLISLSHLHAGQALDAMGKREEALAEYQTVLKRENIFDAHKLANEYVKKAYADDRTKGKI
jgi:predicted Zn-dependent protease